MKYPRSWIYRVNELYLIDGGERERYDACVKILDALSAVGALKDVPKKAEYWICKWCWRRSAYSREAFAELGMCDRSFSNYKPHDRVEHEIIHVREVEE
jgi:hypothetical protein